MLAALLTFAMSGAARADEVEPEDRGALFHPDPPPPYGLRFGAGLLVDLLPRALVEAETRHVPMLTLSARLGLPYDFSVRARGAFILINNELELGPAWTTHLGPVALELRAMAGIWFGFVGVEGFDASSVAFITKPAITAGIDLAQRAKLAVTVEGIVTLAQTVQFGKASVLNRQQTQLAGFMLLASVEHILGGGGIIYYGVAGLYVSPDYQAWLAFSDGSARLLYPRFIAGYGF